MRVCWLLLTVVFLYFTSATRSLSAAVATAQVGDAAAPAAKIKITIGKDTTYITEPLRPDGYPDYVAAHNEIYSRGVTPENNAAVLLQQAFGPGEIPEKLRPQYFEKLGIKPLPEDGDYLVAQSEVIKRWVVGRPAELQDAVREEFYDQFGQAQEHPWTAKEYPIVAEWLKLNERPLQLIVEASRRPKEYFPMTPSDDFLQTVFLLPHIQQVRETANALATRAMLHTGNGDVSKGWQDLLANHRLARLTAQGPILIDVIVAYALEGIAVQGDVVLLHNAKLSPQIAAKMQADLAALPTFPNCAQAIDIGERFFFLDIVVRASREGLQTDLDLSNKTANAYSRSFVQAIGNSIVDWNVPLRMGNQWYDRLVSICRLTDLTKQRAAVKKYEHDLKRLSATAKAPGGFVWDILSQTSASDVVSPRVGELLVALMLPATSAMLNAQTRTLLNGQMDQTAMALAAYRAEHGSYPEKLDSLVPKYLAKIPDDTFATETVRPIQYRREGKAYVLWSVGMDGVDDNARSCDDDPSGDDWVLRPVPRQKVANEAAR